MAQGKTSVYTQDNGVKVQFEIDTYAIRVKQSVIDVYYTKQTLAPVIEEVIKEEQMSYQLNEQDFEDWRNTKLAELVKNGVVSVEDMFFAATLPKIIAENNLAVASK